MITLIILLAITTLVAVGLVYSIMRYSLWRNRALIVIMISALYFTTIFIIFSQYGRVLG